MPGDFRGLRTYGVSVLSFLLGFQISSYIGLSWVLSPFSTFCLGPCSCCGGAGKAWTLTSWTPRWIQTPPLAYCAKGGSSYLSLVSVCVYVAIKAHLPKGGVNSDGHVSSRALCGIRWCFVVIISQFNFFLYHFYFIYSTIGMACYKALPQTSLHTNLRLIVISQGIPLGLSVHGQCSFRITHIFSILFANNFFLHLGSISFCLNYIP